MAFTHGYHLFNKKGTFKNNPDKCQLPNKNQTIKDEEYAACCLLINLLRPLYVVIQRIGIAKIVSVQTNSPCMASS